MGTSRVRVLAGEKGLLSFCRDGRHTSASQYRYRGQGRCSFRLDAAGQSDGLPFDVMVTLPYFDLRRLEVAVVHAGQAEALPEANVERYPQRPDTLLIRGVKHGDTVALGGWDPAAPIVACDLPKPRADADDRAVRLPAGFVPVDLQRAANRKPGQDWSDVKSMAGWQPGRTELYGVPFVLLDPLPQAGRIAVRDAAVPVGQAGSTLFALVGPAAGKAKLTLALDGGKSVQADLREAFRVLRGWPPVFEWEVQWVQVPLGGRKVVAVRADGIDLFAATVAALPAARLARTFAVCRAQQAQARADAATVARLKALQPLFERIAGHIAVLPGTASSTPRSGATAQLLHRAGLIKYLDFVSPRSLIDPAAFNAERYWLALYLGGENYIQSVAGPQDADLALQRYLHRGGTLLVLPSQPYPFYYNEKDEAVANAAAFGLPIIHGWEKPPAEHRYTFVRNAAQKILTGVPDRLPWPEVGDPRFRGVAAPPGSRYTPLLTLEDEKHTKVADAAAWIELTAGDLAGGQVGYVWSTLVQNPDWQSAILTDLLKQGLTAAAPGLAEGVAVRAGTPPAIDGKLDEPLWREAPVYPLAHRFMPAGVPQQAADVRCAWDDQSLYVALHAEDKDAWSTLTQRDGNLWEGEVLEAYLDPDGDGRDYIELEVNPRGALIDLRIGDHEKVGQADSLARYRSWNSSGWRAAASVDGTLDNRADADRGWTVEMALPFADLGVPAPKLGQAWRAQFYRIERPRAGALECSAWSATDTFHNPSRFGRLSFAANPRHDDFGLYPPGADGSPGWLAQAGTWRVTDGRLVGRNSGGDGFQANGIRLRALELGDFALTLRYRLTSRGDDHRDGFWVGFRAGADGSGYTLCLNRDRTELHKAVAGGRSSNDEQRLGQGAGVTGDGWHTLSLTARGANIRAVADGQVVLEAVDRGFLGDPPLKTGGLVLSARKWSGSRGDTVVEIDDVEVR
ncbi:MAG: carbohydrate-binding family 9-like protein [Armatimonadetes bacterium]|nr:carbohydrate-binding family 9-like protein [Armatimonadota bacterium]